MHRIGLGGGCHWCTEAVFQALNGVQKVEQGFVSSTGKDTGFSEAVIVHYNPMVISRERLIEIHLYTHKSTSNHSMRTKYRSAIYVFDKDQEVSVLEILRKMNHRFEEKLVTKVYPFRSFKPSAVEFQNYYLQNPKKPFCQTYIDPKLKVLSSQFSEEIKIL
jgi:peptide-methionine (S)-S-oxide reductase